MKKVLTLMLGVCLFASTAVAKDYMHNPRGSNDRPPPRSNTGKSLVNLAERSAALDSQAAKAQRKAKSNYDYCVLKAVHKGAKKNAHALSTVYNAQQACAGHLKVSK